MDSEELQESLLMRNGVERYQDALLDVASVPCNEFHDILEMLDEWAAQGKIDLCRLCEILEDLKAHNPEKADKIKNYYNI